MSAHLERLIRLYNRLRRGPVTIEIISKWAKQAGMPVSDRQLYRDMNQLKSFAFTEGENVIEYTDEKNRKTWKLEFKEVSEKLSAYDINSFFLLKNLAPYAVIEQRKSSIEKFEKIIYKNASANKFQQYIQANELYLRKTNYNDNKYGELEHQQIEDLIWALHNNKSITVEQDNINPANNNLRPDEFPLHIYPLELVFHRGRLHIAGLKKNKGIVIFALDKNFHFVLTNETFNRKKLMLVYKKIFSGLYGISKPISQKKYHIKLELTKEYADSMKSFHWHDTEKWVTMKNGNCMLHLTCTISREMIGFIANGLDKIKVVQPKMLKDLIIKKLRQTAELYEKNIAPDEGRANADY